MSGRVPLLPTLIVGLAIAAMIALGVWQIGRAREKAALIAVVARNPGRPPVQFPRFPPVERSQLFRPSSVYCLRVVGWRVEAGRAVDGGAGYRYIAHCATGAEGPGALVVLGVAADGRLKPRFAPGLIRGWLAEEPDHRSLIARLMRAGPPLRPMLIARAAAPGLRPPAPPSPGDIANNHIAYAVQWFLFAGVAAVIYALALRRRRPVAPAA